MSNYSGRHGPNVSQYLRDLNTISPQDTTAPEDNFMEEDLALFTNTQFFDFDSGQNTDFQAQPVKEAAPTKDASAAPSVMGDISNLDFMSNDFNFADFNNTYAAPPMNNFTEPNHNFQPLQPSHQIPPQAQYHAAVPAHNGEVKHKAEPMAPHAPTMNMEDTSRVAAEEDKRRRNTAASARFRIKKKQREQALEKSAKEMTDKVTALENKVSQLETENKWLKNLLVEKNEGNEDISALWKEFTKQAGSKLNAKESGATEPTKVEQ